MPANRRIVLIQLLTATAPFFLGAYRAGSLALRHELSAGAFLGEMLGALVLAILASWIVQLVIRGKERSEWLPAITVTSVTLAIAALVYMPQGNSVLLCAILAGLSQLLIALYAVTALRPKFAKALARKNGSGKNRRLRT